MVIGIDCSVSRLDLVIWDFIKCDRWRTHWSPKILWYNVHEELGLVLKRICSFAWSTACHGFHPQLWSSDPFSLWQLINNTYTNNNMVTNKPAEVINTSQRLIHKSVELTCLLVNRRSCSRTEELIDWWIEGLRDWRRIFVYQCSEHIRVELDQQSVIKMIN